MHAGGVAVYVLRDSGVLIDTGAGDPAHMEAVLGLMREAGRPLETVLLTHTHRDHASGLPQIVEATKALIRGHPAGYERIATMVPAGRFRPLADGERLEVSASSIEVIYTAGHSDDSVCFLEAKRCLLFTGDTILGATSTSVSNLGPYMASLERLRSLAVGRIAPGHGPIVDEPRRRIDGYVRHRELRERQILAALVGEFTADDVVRAVYPRLEGMLMTAAKRNAAAHLEKLVEEGRVVASGRGEAMLYSRVDSTDAG